MIPVANGFSDSCPVRISPTEKPCLFTAMDRLSLLFVRVKYANFRQFSFRAIVFILYSYN